MFTLVKWGEYDSTFEKRKEHHTKIFFIDLAKGVKEDKKENDPEDSKQCSLQSKRAN